MTPSWETYATNGKTYRVELAEGVDPSAELDRFVEGTSAWSSNGWLAVGDGEYLRAEQIVSIKVARSGRAGGFA